MIYAFSIAVALVCLLYIFSAVASAVAWQWYVSAIMKPVNPVLYSKGWSKWACVADLAAVAVVCGALAVGLWLGFLWAAIGVMALNALEIYFGTTFYWTERPANLADVAEHIGIHAFMAGGLLMWTLT
jgi:hypothetical protein